jgi:glutaredoxin 2
MNISSGRREVRKLTGKNWVPLLVTDDGEAIAGSQKIVDWAKAHPAA